MALIEGGYRWRRYVLRRKSKQGKGKNQLLRVLRDIGERKKKPKMMDVMEKVLIRETLVSLGRDRRVLVQKMIMMEICERELVGGSKDKEQEELWRPA